MTDQPPPSLPLAGRFIVEHARPGSSGVTQRAIAIAGRIAADLGATVITARGDARNAIDHNRADSIFLDGGKVRNDLSGQQYQGLRLDAVLHDGTQLPERIALAPIKVQLSPGVPAHLEIPDTAITDATILALSGLLDLVGHPDQAPVPLGGHQAAGIAGLAAFSGMMAALATGKPETVHVSALEACLWSNWKSYAERLYMGRTPSRQGKLAEWQAVQCADGYATLVYLEKDWPAVARMIGDLRLAKPPLDTQAGRRADMGKVYQIVRPWYATRTRAEISALARKEGLPIAPVLSVGEVVTDPQYAAQKFFAVPAGGTETPTARVPTIPTVWNGGRFAPNPAPLQTDRSPIPSPSPRRVEVAPPAGGGGGANVAPLAGTRVLDLGIITAGASTSALLADLGADVIKVESSAYIDPFRTWDKGLGAPDWWNQSRFFQFTNRNKRGLALDLKHPEGKALFLELVAKSDVIVENFRRGVLERLGLGWDVLKAANPKLILCSITSQGENGPDAGAASYGSTLEANSGLTDLTRDASGAPLISGILLNYPDQIVSIYAAGIVTLAVETLQRTGEGARLDISQRELATFLIGEHVLAATSPHGETPAARRPDIRRTADGKWVLHLDGGYEVPVWNGDDILRAVARGEITSAFAKAPDGNDAKGVPFTLQGAPFRINSRAPELGEHNGEVLREVLGLDEPRVAALAKTGVIGTIPKN